MTREALEALATRCEQATGPDSNLDREIAVASGQYVEGRGRDGMLAPADRPNEFGYGKPDYTASVDAALTLVPEGTHGGFSPSGMRRFEGRVYEWSPMGNAVLTRHRREAATPALAITAAALRAHAAKEGLASERT